MHSSETSTARRWVMLAATVTAQAGASVSINGAAFLIPTLHDRWGLSLAQAGTLAAAPIAGVMTALYLWGIVVDRIGERKVLLAGLLGTTLASTLATQMRDVVTLGAALFLAGLFAASTASASGRIVVGWFPPHRRGLAMGIRQMAQPLGVALAAATIAVVAERSGVRAALWVQVVAGGIALLAVLAVVQDPPRPPATPALTANPYRASSFLWRIHGVSVLLVLPQFVVWTYSLAWLIQARHWTAGAAGALIAVTHLLGAVGRIAVGQLSDVVRSRVRPLRWVAIAAAVTMLAFGLAEPYAASVALLVIASTVTVADNGLAFTSVAERAGSFWAGRALGLQNTAQYLAATAAAPLAGAAIGRWGYGAAFAAVALFPAIAVLLVPARDQTSRA